MFQNQEATASFSYSCFNQISVYDFRSREYIASTERQQNPLSRKRSLTNTLFCGLCTRERRVVIERNCPLVATGEPEVGSPEDSFVVLRGWLSKPRYEYHVGKRIFRSRGDSITQFRIFAEIFYA